MKNWFFGLLSLMLTSVSAQELNDYSVAENVLWASPDGFDLTMDIYTPDTGRDAYPVLVIFHGGGWLINNKSIMNDMAKYAVEHGEYVVCNVNYRLLVDQNNTVTMDQIVEDVLGAVLWVQTNIGAYKGDPTKVAVTGDSAGGHLAEMVLIGGSQLSSTGFDEQPLGFRPSYLPDGVTCDQLMKRGGIEVQGAVISYGAFDLYASAKGGFEEPSNVFWQMGGAKPRGIFGAGKNVTSHPTLYQLVSPIYNVPLSYERKLPPQLFTVGSKDNLTTPELVSAYVETLREAGQDVTYWVHEGRPHAFMDSGKNDFLGISWEQDGVPAMKKVMQFLDEIFY
ncbi:alpha/beta hydrolase [Marinoscillum sp.]|uniref:alpha/beta hydrolase n=1 Tax=Marinoscillum sp. TaxID=2024838 RepID=UPI003BAB5118